MMCGSQKGEKLHDGEFIDKYFYQELLEPG